MTSFKPCSWPVWHEKFKQKYLNKYDYSLINPESIVDKNTKIPILCSQHGLFYQSLFQHNKSKYGCRKCMFEIQASKRITPREESIQKAHSLHNHLYIYDHLPNPVLFKDRVTIICPEHGDFTSSWANHIHKSNPTGCPKCKNEKLRQKFKKSWDLWLLDFIERHGNKYKYPLNPIYNNSDDKILITCPYHGDFLQGIFHHASGTGCPSCKSSSGERAIRHFLEKNDISFIEQYRFEDCRGIQKPLVFDFYLPAKNICIEYDGKQHFQPIKWFGGEEAFAKSQLRDAIKTQYCQDKKISLIRIKYSENIEQALTENIRNEPALNTSGDRK